MIADATRASELAPSNPIARITSVVFGLVPAWLPLFVLRLTLARPFFASGLTRWDGWFTLSFGTKFLFAQEYKLHIFGAEIPFPMPELVATMASTAEIVLPILLAFGFLTRWAALGLLGMTEIIQLTYPDGWANFHLYWAAMALAIITFGPGAVSLDRLIGLDGWSAWRKALGTPVGHRERPRGDPGAIRVDVGGAFLDCRRFAPRNGGGACRRRAAEAPSPLRIGGEDVILVGHDRVAGEAALRVVLLRWQVVRIAGPEGLGRGVILKRRPSPSAAVGEPLAVLHHEVRIVQCARHGRLARLVLSFLRHPMDLGHPGAVGERLAVARNARLVRLDHRGIAEDDCELVAVVTDGDGLPVLVSFELGKAETTRNLHGISVLRREREFPP